MQIDIDELKTPAIWGLSDFAPALEIYADEQFDTNDSLTVLAGDVNRGDFLHRAAGVVAGRVATFEKVRGIYTTEDSRTNQLATYSAYIRVAGREPIPFLLRFPLAPLHSTQLSVSWTSVKLHALNPIARRNSDVYTREQTEHVIQAAIQAAFLTRFISGIAIMIDGVVEVPSDAVKYDSRILVSSMDEGVTGRVFASRADIDEEVSFVIRSTDDGDNGFVSWMIIK